MDTILPAGMFSATLRHYMETIDPVARYAAGYQAEPLNKFIGKGVLHDIRMFLKPGEDLDDFAPWETGLFVARQMLIAMQDKLAGFDPYYPGDHEQYKTALRDVRDFSAAVVTVVRGRLADIEGQFAGRRAEPVQYQDIRDSYWRGIEERRASIEALCRHHEVRLREVAARREAQAALGPAPVASPAPETA